MNYISIFKIAPAVFGIGCVLFVTAASPAVAQQATVSSSSGSTVPGGTVSLGLTLASSGGALPADVQWTMSYSPSVVASVTVAAGSSATAAGKSVSCAGTIGVTTCIAYGMNPNAISNGLLATATFTISPSALGASTPIQVAGVASSTTAGIAIPGSGQGSTIVLTQQAWTISGTISPTAGGSGATVTLSGAASATTTANASGSYTFSGLANGAYTVTPSKTGYTFTPTNSAVTLNGANQTAINFTTAVQTWTISGTISPTAGGSGATVTLSGAASATTTANASGSYTFSGLANGAYTLTPSKSGYTFTPPNSAVTLNGANQTTINFTTAAQTWTISGTISPTASGSGATMTLSGAASATTTANASGIYTFSGLANGAYTVTPSKTGYTFTPTNSAVTISGANKTAINFTIAAVPTWTISGTISPTAGGSGATVTLSGTASATTTANTSGNYTFSGLANGAYTVTPSKTGYTFTPTNSAVTISGANKTAVNFTAAAQTWTISGTISPTAAGSGSTVALTGAASATTTANASGSYTFSGLANGTYTVTPGKSGYTFTPPVQSVTVSGANLTAPSFTAVQNPPPPITFQQSGSMSQTSGQTASKAFARNVGAADLVIVGVFVDLGAAVSVTDTLGDVFTQVAHQSVATDHDADIFVSAAGSSKADTVTVNAGSGRNVYAFSIHEYSGVTATVDASATAQGSSTAPASGNLTTVNPNDLIFAWFTNGSNYRNENFSSLNSAYTKRELSGTGTLQCYAFANCVESADLVAAATLTTNAAATLNVADIWSATAIAFKGAVFTITGVTEISPATEADLKASVHSSSANGTTPLPDTMPPSIPAALRAPSINSSYVTLSWTASSDNVGVAGYRVFRDGLQVGATSQAAYTDGPLAVSTMYRYTVAAFDAAGNSSATATPELAAITLPASSAFSYPLQASSNGRYLVDQNNVPAFVVGDSPYSLLVNLDPSAMSAYMADRRTRGFNAILVQVLCNSNTGGNPSGVTYDGIAPFTSGSSSSTYDLSTPNPDYFSRLDFLVSLAETYNLTVFLDPLDVGGWMTTLENNGTTNTFNYGVYLGTRYKNNPNIVWDSGHNFNNRNTNSTGNNLASQVLAGIASVDLGSLVTLNSINTYAPTYDMVLHAYTSAAGIPVSMTGANYEFENQSGSLPGPAEAAVLRAQEYWSALSGATSQLYGSHYTWTLNGPAGQSNWQNYLDSPGALQIQYFTSLFQALPWWNLVPDTSHAVVTAGYGRYDASNYDLTQNTYSTAAWVPDGSLALVYDVTGSPLFVDMSQFKSAVTARWYDPANGVYTAIPGSLFANSGIISFTPAAHNSAGDTDWVLVLQASGL